MTNTAVGQGFDKSVEKSMGRRVLRQVWTTSKHEARSHSAAVTPKQGWVSRAQYYTRDIYEGRIYQQYDHDD